MTNPASLKLFCCESLLPSNHPVSIPVLQNSESRIHIRCVNEKCSPAKRRIFSIQIPLGVKLKQHISHCVGCVGDSPTLDYLESADSVLIGPQQIVNANLAMIQWREHSVDEIGQSFDWVALPHFS